MWYRIGADLVLEGHFQLRGPVRHCRSRSVISSMGGRGMNLQPLTTPPTLWTIGHSTRSREDFLALLSAHGITQLIDVRRYPGSRRYPHFHSDALKKNLADAGLVYRHLPDLGGRRPARSHSPNDGWKNASFRGYADYMHTDEFHRAIDVLTAEATRSRTAIMCAEAVPLALPSIIDRRQPPDARLGSGAYHGRRADSEASPHGLCRHPERPACLSCSR
jgi:hypothetical protein